MTTATQRSSIRVLALKDDFMDCLVERQHAGAKCSADNVIRWCTYGHLDKTTQHISILG